ncbi:DUF4242 domain-containing protein [Croceitalea rosinachiae]|uniref:DUF4242 domain-containing protein n=1 Tax=Croceitalea rosinachiae TaxID=3075596 RepID=A0ABU3A706_9FLAO|nr:DUF4242 domain-containing protein [Croceitalea sp. F388]MDT0605673.1 DUF4242 domain-containing protein [Croceitalea sp. F388]
MKTKIILAVTLLTLTLSFAQTKTNMKNEEIMKTYLIEREIPDAGKLTQEELKGISQKSCTVLSEMGSGIEWLHSYVTDDKVYCVYKAENKELLRIHAEKGGFPANRISELSTEISPATALE